ncbi:type II toxin-antitoxin system PemK/MazF family toxin [Zhaonella formicivorans]|uniref:type II toxin-antitoxin system PemK/MazF family toxin n=1 Tax=Zhaonella formicivorans TaxID=2528593 RepID=UPI0010DFC76C|nr:type II toxin-antitoxin system PemK/MazF family toxin [Zhaonella formicivorans]
MNINQYDVYWTDLNPAKGSEINKVRPCVVISPPEMNAYLRTVIVAPVTSKGREGYPTRVYMSVSDVYGWVVLDQIRAIDKSRLCNKIGSLDENAVCAIKSVIKEMLVD